MFCVYWFTLLLARDSRFADAMRVLLMVVVFNVFGVPDSTAQMHVSAFAGVEAFSNSSVFC